MSECIVRRSATCALSICFPAISERMSPMPPEVPGFRLNHTRNPAPGARMGTEGVIVMARAGYGQFSVAVRERIIEVRFGDPLAALGRWGTRWGTGQTCWFRLLRPHIRHRLMLPHMFFGITSGGNACTGTVNGDGHITGTVRNRVEPVLASLYDPQRGWSPWCERPSGQDTGGRPDAA